MTPTTFVETHPVLVIVVAVCAVMELVGLLARRCER
jgi:hypothetical protein